MWSILSIILLYIIVNDNASAEPFEINSSINSSEMPNSLEKEVNPGKSLFYFKSK